MKTCTKCKETKELSCFNKRRKDKEALESSCRTCRNSYQKEYREKPENKEKRHIYINEYNSAPEIKLKTQLYNKKHNAKPEVKESKSIKNKEYESKPEVKEHIITKRKERESNPKNKIRRNNKAKERREADIVFRMCSNLRSRLRKILKGQIKSGSSVRDLGCTGDELAAHLESLFLPGMTRDNYGNKSGQWSMDHILPLSRMNPNSREEFLKYNHYTNIQPMWHIDNIKKGNKIPKNHNLNSLPLKKD